MAVISRHDDQSVIELTQRSEFSDCCRYSVVKLEQIAKGAVIVESVHLLVNRSGLGHQEEPFVSATDVEDVNSFQSHLFKTGEI